MWYTRWYIGLIMVHCMVHYRCVIEVRDHIRYLIWYTEVCSDLLVPTLWYTVPSRVYWLVHSYRPRDILGTYLGTQWYTR